MRRRVASPFVLSLLAFVTVVASAADLASFLQKLQFSFLPPGHELNVSLGLLGTAHIEKMHCRDLRLGGLDAKAEILNPSPDWQGDVRIGALIETFGASCTGTWLYGSEEGEFHVDLATVTNSGGPFIDLSVDLEGRSVRSDAGPVYPFPGKATSVKCSTHFEVESLRFEGAAEWILTLLGDMLSTGVMQDLLRPIICFKARHQGLVAINQALVQARQMAEPILKAVAEDLEAPLLPPGSPALFDLGTSRPLAFAQRLLEQGMWTGGLVDLIQRATGNSDFLSMVFPKGGMSLASISLEQPAKGDVKGFLESVSVLGPQTIERLSLEPTSDRTMKLRMAQQLMNVSVAFRAQADADTSSDAGEDDPFSLVAIRRLGETIVERASLTLVLSGVDVSAHLGALFNAAQVQYLADGMSWYDTACMPSMIMNASALGVDLQLAVESFSFATDGATSEDLESQIDSSINSLLKYLNSPLMQPTVSRLVRSIAAGQARDIANEQLQNWLAAAGPLSAKQCVPNFGTGSVTVALLFTAVALVLALAASILLCRHRKGFCSSAASAPPAPDQARASEEGSRVTEDSHRAWARPAMLLAIASFPLVQCGVIGYPFRAALRLHNGSDVDPLAGDSLLYIFILTLGKEPLQYLPGVIALLLVLVVLFGTSRMIVVIVLALKPQCSQRFHWYLRLSSAVGAWDLAFVFFCIVTQVPSFYAKAFTFGDTYTDLGAQITLSFYALALGFVFLDVATLLTLGPSLAAMKAHEAVASRHSEGPAVSGRHLSERQNRSSGDSRRPPPMIALVALSIALMALVISPFLTLWSYHYRGAVMAPLHYQTDTQERWVTLAGILSDLPAQVLNPFYGIGPFIMQLLIVVHVVIAPILHAALALYVGFRLRHGKSFLKTILRKPARSLESGDTAEPSTFENATSAQQATAAEKAEFAWLSQALTVVRMLAGADAFAMTMLVAVPEVQTETHMLAKQLCSLAAPALDTLDFVCAEVDTTLYYGIFVLLAAALSVRLFAEICAHAPLRARACAESIRTPTPQTPRDAA
eukprot:TRINITY_DN4385_c0_g2_i1.p1 TRINITY_DN4385_c0_g2~~TRINITY_DN4385_c0_g2_i1.p1  ORF type:complete len:1052 (-),score=143.77 TRINITY_DN4385_c0_g2_i1:182-3310(-)